MQRRTKTVAPKKITHYELIGIKESASENEIKKAYLKLSKIWHSDKTPYWAPPHELSNADEIIKRINAANDILLDNSKRAAYDLSLKDPSNTTAEDEQFAANWERLNDLYKKHKAPAAYIDELKLQMDEMQHTIWEQENTIEQLRAELKKFGGERKSEPQYSASQRERFFNSSTSSYSSTYQHTSTENISPKIIPTGLLAIYKVLLPTCTGINAAHITNGLEFRSIALVFDDRLAAEMFITAWSHAKQEKDNRFVFKVDEDESNRSKIILHVTFNIPNALSKWVRSNPVRGEKMLAELSKYVNIENINQEYRRSAFQHYQRDDELPSDNNRSYFSTRM